MGSPNTEHFIVMDNSALFSARQKREGEEKEEKSEPRAEEKEKAALQESHSRSDSGLSSLSSWTAVSKSGCSSVRSSSIVSDCSSKIEELLEEEVGTRTFLSTCSLKLENLLEHECCSKTAGNYKAAKVRSHPPNNGERGGGQG